MTRALLINRGCVYFIYKPIAKCEKNHIERLNMFDNIATQGMFKLIFVIFLCP